MYQSLTRVGSTVALTLVLGWGSINTACASGTTQFSPKLSDILELLDLETSDVGAALAAADAYACSLVASNVAGRSPDHKVRTITSKRGAIWSNAAGMFIEESNFPALIERDLSSLEGILSVMDDAGKSSSWLTGFEQLLESSSDDLSERIMGRFNKFSKSREAWILCADRQPETMGELRRTRSYWNRKSKKLVKQADSKNEPSDPIAMLLQVKEFPDLVGDETMVGWVVNMATDEVINTISVAMASNAKLTSGDVDPRDLAPRGRSGHEPRESTSKGSSGDEPKESVSRKRRTSDYRGLSMNELIEIRHDELVKCVKQSNRDACDEYDRIQEMVSILEG